MSVKKCHTSVFSHSGTDKRNVRKFAADLMHLVGSGFTGAKTLNNMIGQDVAVFYWFTPAYLLGVMVYEFLVVFNNSMARENWPWLQTRVSPVLDWVIYLCFGAKILLGTKYNGRSILCAGMLYFVARWVYFNGQNIWWLGLCRN